MSPRIIGESGVVLDVDRAMARGLVRDGFAKLADGESEDSIARPDSDTATTIEQPSGPPVTSSGNVAPEIVRTPESGAADDNDGQDAQDGKPRGNAARDEWVTYALANGKTEDDLDGLKQTEIRALFETTEE